MIRNITYSLLCAIGVVVGSPLHALTLGDMLQPQKTKILHNSQEEGWDFTLKEVILTQKLHLPSTEDWERISTYKRKHEDSLILFVRYKVDYSMPIINKGWWGYKLANEQNVTEIPPRVMIFNKWLNLYTADGTLIENVYQTISTNTDKDTIAIVEAPAKMLLGAKLGWDVRYFNVGARCKSGHDCKQHEFHFTHKYENQYIMLPEPAKQFFASLNITHETNVEKNVSKKWIIGEKTPEAIDRETDRYMLDLKMQQLESEMDNLMNSM